MAEWTKAAVLKTDGGNPEGQAPQDVTDRPADVDSRFDSSQQQIPPDLSDLLNKWNQLPKDMRGRITDLLNSVEDGDEKDADHARGASE